MMHLFLFLFLSKIPRRVFSSSVSTSHAIIGYLLEPFYLPIELKTGFCMT